MRINIGCGQSPTSNWRNFDNSLSLRLARYPALVSVLKALRLIDESQLGFIAFARKTSIEWADATKRIPVRDGSVEVLYASHMLEHLDRLEAASFLEEAKRVLCSGGVLRIVVPDLASQVRSYVSNGDADAFVEVTHLTQPKPHTMFQKLKNVIVGGRHHHWMYDGLSLCRLLERFGFNDATVVEPGQTCIPNPGHLNLYERAGESVFVEALHR